MNFVDISNWIVFFGLSGICVTGLVFFWVEGNKLVKKQNIGDVK